MKGNKKFWEEYYEQLRCVIRLDMNDRVLLGDLLENTNCKGADTFHIHLLDRIEENLLALDELTRGVTKNEK